MTKLRTSSYYLMPEARDGVVGETVGFPTLPRRNPPYCILHPCIYDFRIKKVQYEGNYIQTR